MGNIFGSKGSYGISTPIERSIREKKGTGHREVYRAGHSFCFPEYTGVGTVGL